MPKPCAPIFRSSAIQLTFLVSHDYHEFSGMPRQFCRKQGYCEVRRKQAWLCNRVKTRTISPFHCVSALFVHRRILTSRCGARAAARLGFSAAELLAGSGKPKIASVPHCGETASPTWALVRFLHVVAAGTDGVLMHIQDLHVKCARGRQ